MEKMLAYYCYRRIFYAAPKKKDGPIKLPDGEQYFSRREQMLSLIDEMSAIPFEQVYITSFDGLKLAARYYHVKDGAPVHIQFHGYKGWAYRDFCGGNKLARERGFNTLVVDQRAHGKSEGNTISMGINERFDCLSWVKYICERFGNDVKIVISGVSMGAATVLMAAELDLPENVIGIIADCPYSSPKEIITKVCRDMKLPAGPLYPFVKLGARLYGHFDLEAADAAEAVCHAKVPVLLIHGEDDRFVPCSMSKKIYDSAKSSNADADIIIETFPEAGHGISFMTDAKRYGEVLDRALALMEERSHHD